MSFCDFILGKKSPLWNNDEDRHEISMGGFNPPQFGPLIRLVTVLIKTDLGEEFQLSEQEREMLMTQDVLKIVLSQGQDSTEMSLRIADMCKGNKSLTLKVCGVFAQQIGQSSQVESILKVLPVITPFLKTKDDQK